MKFELQILQPIVFTQFLENIVSFNVLKKLVRPLTNHFILHKLFVHNLKKITLRKRSCDIFQNKHTIQSSFWFNMITVSCTINTEKMNVNYMEITSLHQSLQGVSTRQSSQMKQIKINRKV